MPQEELDLFDFATRGVAQLCAGSAQIVWCNMIQLRPFGTPPNHVPDDVLGNTFSPGRSVTAHGPENAASADLGCNHPTVDRLLNPDGHGYGPNMPAIAD